MSKKRNSNNVESEYLCFCVNRDPQLIEDDGFINVESISVETSKATAIKEYDYFFEIRVPSSKAKYAPATCLGIVNIPDSK